MKYVSLFAGIGGFDLALNRLGHECVYANDFDKYCKIVYDKNFKSRRFKGKARPNGRQDIFNERDKSNTRGTKGQQQQGVNIDNGLDTTPIQEVPTDSIPDHDLLVGGFPCQAFSIAGKRRGFDDTRGTLFFDIARILKAKQPRFFLLENVKGLLSHNNGRTFKTIISTLVELGYDLQWQVLNSKNFGVTQNRERVFIVGHIRGEPRPKVFPIGEIDSGIYKQEKDIQSEIQPTRKTGNITYANKSLLETRGDRPLSIRRLTPLECERLQGFPDSWTEGVSDTQRYKMLGNAVTVNVIYEVAKRLNGR